MNVEELRHRSQGSCFRSKGDPGNGTISVGIAIWVARILEMLTVLVSMGEQKPVSTSTY